VTNTDSEKTQAEKTHLPGLKVDQMKSNDEYEYPSDETINDDTDKKMPYCPRWNFMSLNISTLYGTKPEKDLFAI